jgi:hypothetical protein
MDKKRTAPIRSGSTQHYEEKLFKAFANTNMPRIKRFLAQIKFLCFFLKEGEKVHF